MSSMAPPANSYQPGTKLTVGSHDVSIIKYISQGGFAYVYTCTIDPPFQNSTVGCLKRVLVPNKWQLNLLRQEVDAMKRLRGNPTIVSYIDSHASRITLLSHQASHKDSTQQYEVFLLMEYCSNNGLIDFMNTRLTNRLTEPEILVIMRDITRAVAMCHHLQPPLIHRDIKIENVLLDEKRTYKLCDFGSAVPYAPVPTTPKEFQELKDDIMQHTTPQYRSPEMIDLSRGFPIDDKLDIWALGCFLYKLCYYTTPFELLHHSSLQDLENLILNCSHTLKMPYNTPSALFSPRLKNVIKCCLREDPRRRPNAVQLLDEVCNMLNEKPPSVIPASVLERPITVPIKSSTSNTTNNNNNNEVLLNNNSTSVQELSAILSSMPSLEIRKASGGSKSDPFSNIDKSKLLQSTNLNQRPKSVYGSVNHNKQMNKPAIHRPNSIYGSRDILPATSQSSSHLKDYIQKQLSRSSENIATHSRDNDNDDTLHFLKDMEDDSKQGGLGSRQNTGGSFKASFKNGLRKISTGNSSTGVRSSNNTGNNYINNKRSSISSIKQILTGSRKSSNNHEYEEPPVEVEKPIPPKKLSIQRRMAQYLNNTDEQVKKTAHGYGRFTTAESDTDDMEAINNHSHKNRSLQPPKVPTSLSSSTASTSQSTTSTPKSRSFTPPSTQVNKEKPSYYSSNSKSLDIPKSKKSSSNEQGKQKLHSATSSQKSLHGKPKKIPPPKPKKPLSLRTPESNYENERRLSNSSEISMPDLDDLEKQFAKRFPSYV